MYSIVKNSDLSVLMCADFKFVIKIFFVLK